MNRRQRAEIARIRPTVEQQTAVEQLEAVAEWFGGRARPKPSLPPRPGEERAVATGAQVAARRRLYTPMVQLGGDA